MENNFELMKSLPKEGGCPAQCPNKKRHIKQEHLKAFAQNIYVCGCGFMFEWRSDKDWKILNFEDLKL